MTTEYPEFPDGSVDIGGRKYRTGFLKAEWGEDGADEPSKTRNFKLRVQRENALYLNGRIYHYTTIAGLKGIIESNGFWASDNRFMNDTEELRHGFELVRNVVKELGSRERLPNFKSILTAIFDILPKPHENSNLITCFSLSRDSLEQWRGYGPSGGICIGLGRANSDEVSPLIDPPDLLLHRVTYAKRAKIVRLISIIRRFRQQYIKDRKAMECWPDDHDNNYTERLSHSLTFASVLFKNDAFRSEQEVRYVITPAHASRFTDGMQFRASSVGLIPYVNTAGYGPQDKRLPISEVIVGPSPHQDVIAGSLAKFLKAKGYHDVQVELSNVPFRSF